MAFSFSFLLDGKFPARCDERDGIGLSYCSIPSTQHRIGMWYLGFDTVVWKGVREEERQEGTKRRRKVGSS